MKLIITQSIEKTEIEPNKGIFDLEILKIAAKKTIRGLGKNIKSNSKLTGTQLKKINLTATGGAGRALFLLKVGKSKVILVMLRSKNDKQIGVNMSVNNTKFKKVLQKNIDLILQDLKEGSYIEIGL